MRRHHFLDQGRKLGAVERLARGGELGELGQNLAAALRLLAQQLDVLGMGGGGLERALELAHHHRNGRERRAELVRGGGSEAVELREVLLAREHQLGRGERVGQEPRLLGDLPRVGADHPERHQEREPDAEPIDRRQR